MPKILFKRVIRRIDITTSPRAVIPAWIAGIRPPKRSAWWRFRHSRNGCRKRLFSLALEKPYSGLLP
ncbi:MAG: hypothetical protein QX196_15050 [Methylococcaceae bacterium]